MPWDSPWVLPGVSGQTGNQETPFPPARGGGAGEAAMGGTAALPWVPEPARAGLLEVRLELRPRPCSWGHPGATRRRPQRAPGSTVRRFPKSERTQRRERTQERIKASPRGLLRNEPRLAGGTEPGTTPPAPEPVLKENF